MGTRVYIGGLSHDVRDREVESFFAAHGKIVEIEVKRGFGFVEFDDPIAADDAVHELNGKKFQGTRVTVDFARPLVRRTRETRDEYSTNFDSRFLSSSSRRSNYKLVVQNLSSGANDRDLKAFMEKAGDVTYAEAHEHRRNEGLVDFATRADRRNAIRRLDDTKLNGRRVKLVEYRAPRSRSRSVSRLRSRRKRYSRSRSNSRSTSRSETRRKRYSRSRSILRSKLPSRAISRSNSRSISRSENRRKRYSRSRSILRSKLPSRAISRSNSRSISRSETRRKRYSRSRSISRSKLPSRSISRSISRSKSRSRSNSWSKSPTMSVLSPKSGPVSSLRSRSQSSSSRKLSKTATSVDRDDKSEEIDSANL